jgi:hypothetical protein
MFKIPVQSIAECLLLNIALWHSINKYTIYKSLIYSSDAHRTRVPLSQISMNSVARMGSTG